MTIPQKCGIVLLLKLVHKIEKIRKGDAEMATREEKIKELNALYAKATTEEEYAQAYKSAVSYYYEASRAGEPFQVLAEIMLPGYWAEYYRLKKFPQKDETEQEQKINFHVSWVDQYYRQVPKENTELKLNYGYLLSVSFNYLKGDFEEARKVDEEIQRLAKETKNIAIIIKAINAHGLTAMQKKDWPAAIAIFSRAEKSFTEAFDVPDVWQHFANTLNNRGMSRLNLSDGTDQWQEKRGIISSGIVDLWNAEELYMKVTPPPLKHIDGIENRFIMAAIRLLSTEGKELAEMGQKVKAAFEAKDRDGAKKLIFTLRAITDADFKKLTNIEGKLEPEVVADGGTMTFIKSVQIGLQMADEFLEKNKEKKQ